MEADLKKMLECFRIHLLGIGMDEMPSRILLLSLRCGGKGDGWN